MLCYQVTNLVAYFIFKVIIVAFVFLISPICCVVLWSIESIRWISMHQVYSNGVEVPTTVAMETNYLASSQWI